MRRLAPPAALLAALLAALAGCGDSSGGDTPPSSDELVPITQRAIAAVALEYLPTDTSSRTATNADEHTPRGELGTDLRYHARGEDDGDLVRIRISPNTQADQCYGADGCDEVTTPDGSRAVLSWDEVEPEEDPGYVELSLVVDGQVVNIMSAIDTIEGDPRDQDLSVSLDSMLEVVQDARLRLRTAPEVVELGEQLPDWDGGEPDPHAYDRVPATDRSMATAYLSAGGAGSYTFSEPSPLKAGFGPGTVGARLHRDRSGKVPATVIDVLASPGGPGWLRGDPCAGPAYQDHCLSAKAKRGTDYLLWRPASDTDPGEIWVAQVRADEVVAIRTAGPRVPERANGLHGVKGMSDWYVIGHQLHNRNLSLSTTKWTVEDNVTDREAPWQG